MRRIRALCGTVLFGAVLLSLAGVREAQADLFLFGGSGGAQTLEVDLIGGGTLSFSTGTSQFTPGIQNQGWWSEANSNTDDNDNYFVGNFNDTLFLNNFFTFDLAELASTAVGARLIVDSAQGSASFGEPLGTATLDLYDVSTDAATLNLNVGTSAAIFTDLGSGRLYGSYGVSTGTSFTLLTFDLNSDAVADINSAAGGFFSIGGTLSGFTPSAVPEPSTIVLLASLLPVGLLALRRRRRSIA